MYFHSNPLNSGDLAFFNKLLKLGAPVNARCSHTPGLDHTPLTSAAAHGRLELVHRHNHGLTFAVLWSASTSHAQALAPAGQASLFQGANVWKHV